MQLTAEIISWIASISVASAGLPQLIYVFRTKKIDKPFLYSWWIFLSAVMMFGTWGLLSGYKQIIISESIAITVTALTITGLIKYRTDINETKNKKIIQYFLAWSAVGYIAIVFVLFTLNSNFDKFNLGRLKFNEESASKTAILFSILGPALSTIAFLPQTILGIKNKSLHGLSLFFILNLLLFNVAWTLAFSLKFHIETNSNIRVSLLISLLFQVISFLIALVQSVFWIKQVKGKKIILI